MWLFFFPTMTRKWELSGIRTVVACSVRRENETVSTYRLAFGAVGQLGQSRSHITRMLA